MEIRDLFSMEKRSQAWSYVTLLSSLPFLLCLVTPIPKCLAFGVPERGRRLSPVCTLWSRALERLPCLPEGWGLAPDSCSVSLRDKGAAGISLSFISSLPSLHQGAFFRQFFPSPPVSPPLHFNTTDILVSVCVQRFPGESRTGVMAEIFLCTLSPRTSFHPLEVQCHCLPRGECTAVFIHG